MATLDHNKIKALGTVKSLPTRGVNSLPMYLSITDSITTKLDYAILGVTRNIYYWSVGLPWGPQAVMLGSHTWQETGVNHFQGVDRGVR